MNPKYPYYVVSKGRPDTRFTSKALDFMGVSHYIVVEAQEHDWYDSEIKKWEKEVGVKSFAKLLVLDMKYKQDYELLDNFGLSKSTGPGPARNFAWDHAIRTGHAWH